MTYLTLIDTALYQRDVFKEEDIVAYDKAVTEHVTNNMTAKNDREAVFRSGQQIKKANAQYARQREQLTDALAQEVQTALLGMAPEAQMGFKATGNALQLLVDEFFKTDNVTNIVAVAKAYNNGAFKSMFEPTVEQKMDLLKAELSNVNKWLNELPEGADAEDVEKATAHKRKVIEDMKALATPEVKIEDENNYDITKEE